MPPHPPLYPLTHPRVLGAIKGFTGTIFLLGAVDLICGVQNPRYYPFLASFITERNCRCKCHYDGRVYMQGLNQTFQVSQLVLQNMFSPEGNWNWRKDDLKKAEELVKKDRNTDAANRPTGGKGV